MYLGLFAVFKSTATSIQPCLSNLMDEKVLESRYGWFQTVNLSGVTQKPKLTHGGAGIGKGTVEKGSFR